MFTVVLLILCVVEISCTDTDMSVSVTPYDNVDGVFNGKLYMSATTTFDFTTTCNSGVATGTYTFDTINYDGSQSGDCSGIMPVSDLSFSEVGNLSIIK